MTDLRSYIDQVKKMGQLHTISKKVSTKFEIASLTAQVDNSNAILFDNIKESKLRLVA
ncbi:MAG: UbiD family decarboxylase, partial [Thaumarchaeota archaeon]|nr:UbiD family decarboxylase [Nitrososphaerota archaeon]